MAQQQESKTSVMVCVDGSNTAKSAFDFYRDNLHAPNHHVLVVHVSDVANIPSMYFMAEAMALNDIEMEREITRIKRFNHELNAKYKELCESAKMDFEVLTVSGDDGVGKAIIDAMTTHGANMVVMGTRGLGTIRRTLLGSSSDYVLHHAHVPVFICPA